MAASHSLPLELITEILAKLPVKPLHRFRCVSKTWNSLITSSKFIKHHLRQTLISNTNTNTNIIIPNNNSLLSSAISTVKLRFDIINHPLNNLPHRPAVDIIESLHGLLLIADYPKKTLFLFNPSNKTHRLVPPAPSRKPAFVFGLLEVLGFGYDGVTDDYKVVKLVQWFDEHSGMCSETCVYSMRNDSWESFYDKTVLYTLQQINAITVEEKLYFVASSMDYKPVLKCFDLRTSTFSIVNHPELDSYVLGKMTMSLRNLRGCLCLVMNYQKHRVDPAKAMGDPLYNRQFLNADVWELKDCKWVKLLRIRKKEIDKDCIYLRLVTYSKDMKSVLVEVDGIWFGWYDLVTKRIETVPVQGLRVEDSPYLACTYVESLVSVVSKKEGTTRPKKIVKKNDFLSSGFKLKL